jgi:hypothetical protein
VAVVIIITIVITIMAIIAELCLKAKSITLLPVISILIIKIVGLVYINIVFLKKLLKSYIVNA